MPRYTLVSLWLNHPNAGSEHRGPDFLSGWHRDQGPKAEPSLRLVRPRPTACLPRSCSFECSTGDHRERREPWELQAAPGILDPASEVAAVTLVPFGAVRLPRSAGLTGKKGPIRFGWPQAVVEPCPPVGCKPALRRMAHCRM